MNEQAGKREREKESESGTSKSDTGGFTAAAAAEGGTC